MRWRPLAAGTLRLRAGLQEGDEEAAASLRPAPPARSVASAAPPGCSGLLSALSRLSAAPAWARRRRRRVSAGEIGIRGSAPSLCPESLLQVLAWPPGTPRVPPEAGKGGGCPPAGRQGSCERGPGGGPAGVTFRVSRAPAEGARRPRGLVSSRSEAVERNSLPRAGRVRSPCTEGRLQPGALGGVRDAEGRQGSFLPASGGPSVDVGTEASLRVSCLGVAGGTEGWSGESNWSPCVRGAPARFGD